MVQEVDRQYKDAKFPCSNALIASGEDISSFVACKLLASKSSKGEPRYSECAVCPWVLDTRGHCTGDVYTTVFSGGKTFYEDFAQACPGFNKPKCPPKKIREYESKLEESMKEKIRADYAKQGIQKAVL